MIEVDVVTPSRKLIVGAKTTQVRLPGTKGELLVLPGHTELITLLDTGVLSFPEDGVEKKYAISFGLAEIRDDKVLILAETAEAASEIDVSRAKNAQKKAEEVLAGTLPEGQFRKQELKLQRAIVRQQVSES